MSSAVYAWPFVGEVFFSFSTVFAIEFLYFISCSPEPDFLYDFSSGMLIELSHDFVTLHGELIPPRRGCHTDEQHAVFDPLRGGHARNALADNFRPGCYDSIFVDGPIDAERFRQLTESITRRLWMASMPLP